MSHAKLGGDGGCITMGPGAGDIDMLKPGSGEKVPLLKPGYEEDRDYIRMLKPGSPGGAVRMLKPGSPGGAIRMLKPGDTGI
jgi:hypothetical protein